MLTSFMDDAVYKTHFIEVGGRLAAFHEISELEVHVTVQIASGAPWAGGLQVLSSVKMPREEARKVWRSLAAMPGARIERDRQDIIA